MNGRDVKQILAKKYIIRRFAALLILAVALAVPAMLGAYSYERDKYDNHNAVGSKSNSLSYEQIEPHVRAYIEKIRPVESGGEAADSEGNIASSPPGMGVPLPDVAIGAVLIYAGDKAPEGFLICDGSEAPRGKYRELYSVIGDKYGDGDGVTTFNLPDMGTLPAGGVEGADAVVSDQAEPAKADLAFSKASDDSGPPPIVDLDEEKSYGGDDSTGSVAPAGGRAVMYFIIKF
jgi:hypothetical protein